MQVTYSEKARESREGYALLQRATERLEEIVRRSLDPVTAEWDRTQDDGEPLYTLRLADWSGSATVDFRPKDLGDSGRLDNRLYRVWDELLEIRSHKLLERLRGSGESEE